MSRILQAVILFSLVSLSNHAYAAFISGSHTVNGKQVNLSGLEWLSLDVTAGKRYIDLFEASLESDGDANGRYDQDIFKGIAGENIGSGWRLATVAETRALFDSLFADSKGTIYGGAQNGLFYFDAAAQQAADWFFNHFASLGGSTSFKYGEKGGCGGQFSKISVCQGSIYQFGSYTNYNNTGNSVNLLNSGGASSGSFLVRTSQGNTPATSVDEPSSIMLFSLTLLGLGFTVRKSAKRR